MNERIKKLAEQCTTINDSTTVPIDKDFDYEKFAELIVKECAKALDEKLANPNGASMAYCDGSDLLEYFGVKE